MASAQMLSSKTGALSGTSINRPAPAKMQRTMVNSRPRTVVVSAAQGPNELVMKTFGALAAAQFALLPMAAPAMADLLPKTATSQTARDKLNAKTSALPSLKKTAENAGEALSGDTDFAQGAKNAANKLDQATGGDLAGQAKSTAQKASNKASGAVPNNPAKAFANKAKSLGDDAKASVTSNPAKEFANRAKSAVRDALPTDGPATFDYRLLQKDVSQALQQKTAANAKALGAKVKSGVADVPSPQDFANKTKKAVNKAGGSIPDPSEFTRQAKKAANKAGNAIPNPSDFTKQANKAKSSVKQATGSVSNPAKEFANQAKKAKAKASNTGLSLPVAAPVYDYSSLQTDVGFLGFGGNKAEKVASKVQSKASEVADKVPSAGAVADKVPSAGAVADKAGNLADKASEAADKATPNSFNIFDSGSVKEAQNTLKQNVEKAAAEKSDPAERVFPIGKPGETQEDNAERIRLQSENGATPMGDARAPTGGN